MRAIYAVSFEFEPGTSPDKVLAAAAGWFARGSAPEEVRHDWTPGRRTYPLPDDGHALDVEVFESGEGRLWHGTWRHPHADDPDLHLVSDVEIGVAGDAVTLSLVVRAVWAIAKVAPPRFDFRAPRLARLIIDEFGVRDGGHQLATKPHRLDAPAVPGFIEELLLDPSRTRPVVFISDDPRHMAPNIDPVRLARELAGLAHVYFAVYGRPSAELRRRLGPLGCGDGGVRTWWPGLREADDPFRHLLLTGRALRDWTGEPAERMLFRRISTAAAMNASPPSHQRLRRAGRQAQLAHASDEDTRKFLDLALADNENLVEDNKNKDGQIDTLQADKDGLLGKVESLEQQLDQERRNFAQALQHPGVMRTQQPEPVEEEPEIGNVRDAVEAAASRCPHLAFADRAFESADDSPYEKPEDVLDALLKLERLAALWARPEGIGGMDLGQKATDLGLDWKVEVSQTAKGGKTARHYEFTWRGEKRIMGPHVRLGSGRGAGRIARIYLDRYEPEDPLERRLIVAHAGRKLPDSTTG